MKNNRKGFTTVELVIVIAVIAILAAVLIPTFSNLITKANNSAAMQEARGLYTIYISQVDAQIADNVCVKVDDLYFYVNKGEFNTTGSKTAPQSGLLLTAKDKESVNIKCVGTCADITGENETADNICNTCGSCTTHTYDKSGGTNADADGKCNVCKEACEHSGDPCAKCGFVAS